VSDHHLVPNDKVMYQGEPYRVTRVSETCATIKPLNPKVHTIEDKLTGKPKMFSVPGRELYLATVIPESYLIKEPVMA